MVLPMVAAAAMQGGGGVGKSLTGDLVILKYHRPAQIKPGRKLKDGSRGPDQLVAMERDMEIHVNPMAVGLTALTGAAALAVGAVAWGGIEIGGYTVIKGVKQIISGEDSNEPFPGGLLGIISPAYGIYSEVKSLL